MENDYFQSNRKPLNTPHLEKHQNCNTCMFFCKDNRFCRRNPPQVVVLLDEKRETLVYRTKFPIIEIPEKDYCGEYKSTLN